MGASLGSPTLGATVAQLRNRIPTQWRRYVPVYIAVVLVILFFNMVPFESDEHISAIRHTSKGGSHGKLPRPAIRAEFPKKIWQTWKVNQFSFEPRDLDRARSWTDKNPDWRYEVLTDANEEQYVEYHFGPDNFNRPDIVKFYKDVRAAIVKADLLRYIIMYVEGGVYADIDVEAMKPMSKFIPERYNHRDIDMVIGVEIDEPDWKDHPILGPKSRSFCQWTFVCKPQLPVMMRLIEQIMTWLEGVAKKQGVSISDVKLDFDEIISGTGPSAFTTAIITEMNENSAHPVTWDDFHDLGESKVVSRFLVMTVEAFAAGQGHSDSGNHGARAALVKHHYHASNWPSRHPRYSHPAYGEVENCNWNDECVRRWDEDVAAFGKMTKQEQDKIVEEKNREKQEKKEEEERKQREEEDQRRREQEEREKQDREREERERAEREQAEKDKKAAEGKKQ